MSVWNMFVNAIDECIEYGKLCEAISGNAGIAMATISNTLGPEATDISPKEHTWKHTRPHKDPRGRRS